MTPRVALTSLTLAAALFIPPNFPYRRGGGGGGSAHQKVARYTTAAGQSIGASTVTIVNFDTADSNNTLTGVTTGASWAFVPPKDGWYRIEAEINILLGTSTAIDTVFFLRSGTTGISTGSQFSFTTASGGSTISHSLSTTVYLLSTGSYNVAMFQASGGAGKNLTTTGPDNFISITQL